MTRRSSTFGLLLTVPLSLESRLAAKESLRPFARAARDELERGEGRFRVVLVELGELEAELWIVDRLDERGEVGERARLVAARLGDLAAGANRLGPSSAPN